MTPRPLPALQPHHPTPDDLPTSELLIRIVEDHEGSEISVGELIDALGERAFGLILLLLTVPAAVPGPPGIPSVFAVPILIVASQMFRGRPSLWFPEIIRRRRVPRDGMLMVLRRVRPILRRLERVCTPRLLPMTEGLGERWLGAFIFLCALVLANPIPIPFSHLPLAFAMVILSLGYIERDGYVLIAGGLGALFGIAFNISLMGSVFVALRKLLNLILQ